MGPDDERVVHIPHPEFGLEGLVIDSATYMLMISSPGINNVAMSLYNIMT